MPLTWNIIFSCILLQTTYAALDKLGVTPDSVQIAEEILRQLGGDDLFQVVPIATENGRFELDRLRQIEEQIQSENYFSIIGPYDRLIGMVTETLNVPYLCTWVSEDRANTFGILPHPEDLWSAFQDVLVKYDWNHIGLLYEDTKDFDILKGFLEKSRTEVEVWRVTKGISPDQAREMLKRMRDDRQVKNYLVLTTPPLIRRFFRSARRLGMISPTYNWMVPNLVSDDISKNILEDIQVSVTAISLVNETERGRHGDLLENIEAAGIFDAIQMLLKIKRANLRQLTGEQILTKINQTRFQGVTGPIEFDQNRRRINFKFNITEFRTKEFVKVGEWRALPPSDLRKKLVWMPEDGDDSSTGIFPLKGRVSRVVTILEKPFTMLKEDHELREGNDRYEGFAVDLLELIAEELEFEYEVYIVPDGQFGSKKPTGEWNGMIGEVLNGNATMTMAPLSINADRERAIDFTKPFKTRGIAVLMKTPESQASYFQFLKPLSTTVWLCILLAVLVTSVILYALERYKNKSRRGDTQSFRVRESCWFVFGSLVQVGTDVSPVSIAGRMLTSAWWLFSLMMVSTYTANLAAFLTVKKIQPPISTVTDLAGQAKIQFGTVRNSGVESFFKKTKIPAFAEMWAYMDDVFEDTMVNNTLDGLERVKQGNYAFLWDNTVTSFMAKEDCKFTEIGPSFDPKGFGIGVPPGATYREPLSLAILRLGDDGKISELENTWWGGGNCEDFTKPTADTTSELQLENVAGIFFILFGGFALSILIWALARLLAIPRQRSARKENSSYSLPDANGSTTIPSYDACGNQPKDDV